MLRTITTLLLIAAALLLSASASADASAPTDSNGTHCEPIANTTAELCSISDEESNSGSTERFVVFHDYVPLNNSDHQLIPNTLTFSTSVPIPHIIELPRN